MQNPFFLSSIFFVSYKFPIDRGEVAGVVIIGWVGHVPPESFEVFAQTLVFEDMAAVGKWQVADDALTESLVGRNHSLVFVGAPVLT